MNKFLIKIAKSYLIKAVIDRSEFDSYIFHVNWDIVLKRGLKHSVAKLVGFVFRGLVIDKYYQF